MHFCSWKRQVFLCRWRIDSTSEEREGIVELPSLEENYVRYLNVLALASLILIASAMRSRVYSGGGF
jgi:hypothetical protein